MEKDIYEVIDGLEFIPQKVEEQPVLHKYLVDFLVDRFGSLNPDYRTWERETHTFVSALNFMDAEHLFAEWCSKHHLVANVISISEVE